MRKFKEQKHLKLNLLVLAAITLLSAGTEIEQSPKKSATASIISQAEQTLYFGGDIITMQGDKPQYVETVLERDGKIIYVGDKSSALTAQQQGNFSGTTIKVYVLGKTL